ncbi:MAG: hypothetical protein ACOX8U_11425 [Bradymonadia bacterium]|jgi:hypothetical protein
MTKITKSMPKLIFILAFFVVLLPTPALAQDFDEGQLLLFEPYEGPNDLRVPRVSDTVAPSVFFEDAQQQYLALSLGFYQMVTDLDAKFVSYDALHPVDNEVACRALNNAVLRYIQLKEGEITKVVKLLSLAAAEIDDASKSKWAKQYSDKLTHHPLAVRGQRILYECLHRFKRLDQSPMNFRFDRTMRTYFSLHQPLIDAVLGNVD